MSFVTYSSGISAFAGVCVCVAIRVKLQLAVDPLYLCSKLWCAWRGRRRRRRVCFSAQARMFQADCSVDHEDTTTLCCTCAEFAFSLARPGGIIHFFSKKVIFVGGCSASTQPRRQRCCRPYRQMAQALGTWRRTPGARHQRAAPFARHHAALVAIAGDP